MGVLLLFLASCSTQIEKGIVVNDTLVCSTDSDCVPDSCCHARGAVNSAYAPSCFDIMCSLSCEPDTLDCGGGEVKCMDNKCVAVISR